MLVHVFSVVGLCLSVVFLLSVFLGRECHCCTRLCSFPRMGIACPFRAFGCPYLEQGYAFLSILPFVALALNNPIFLGPRKAPSKPAVDWKAIVQSNQDLQSQLQVYLDAVTPEGNAAAVSVETTLLTQELRSDRQYGVGGRPLRLLSLGSFLFSSLIYTCCMLVCS